MPKATSGKKHACSAKSQLVEWSTICENQFGRLPVSVGRYLGAPRFEAARSFHLPQRPATFINLNPGNGRRRRLHDSRISNTIMVRIIQLNMIDDSKPRAVTCFSQCSQSIQHYKIQTARAIYTFYSKQNISRI